MEFLKEGDVIELKEGTRVYADVPKHFVYENRRGDYSITHHDVKLGGEFDYLMGRYIVVKTTFDGGGSSHDGSYPDGHHVWCVKSDDSAVRVDFYQSGCFTATNENIKPIGCAKLQWTIDP